MTEGVLVAAMLVAWSFGLGEYDAGALRDPFRAPERSQAVGILTAGERVCAIVRGEGGVEEVVVPGDVLDGSRVESIDAEGIVLRTPEGTMVHRMLVEERPREEAGE
ncbi:MAG: hypothetical protein CME06_01390 [Gemmatimonadetes bacterium]|nr:hypothetical protein [Gemmatimonadota bacterium]